MNLNDGSNEGIIHKSRPIFSYVMFHVQCFPNSDLLMSLETCIGRLYPTDPSSNLILLTQWSQKLTPKLYRTQFHPEAKGGPLGRT